MMVKRMLILLLIVLKEAGPTAAQPCSSSCPADCYCGHRDLTSVPQYLPTNITTLDLSVNDITTISQSNFSRYRSLERIRLTANKISIIHNETFHGLTNLTALAFALNQLTNIPADIFQGLGKLRGLYLSENQLISLQADIFEGLGNLATLFLNHNRLTSLPAGIFDGLNKLQTLRLNRNRLTSLNADVFPVLASVPQNSVHINDNPWQCDCQMLPFKQLMNGSYAFESQIICAGPAKLKGKSLLKDVDVNRKALDCLSSASCSLSPTLHAMLALLLAWLVLP